MAVQFLQCEFVFHLKALSVAKGVGPVFNQCDPGLWFGRLPCVAPGMPRLDRGEGCRLEDLCFLLLDDVEVSQRVAIKVPSGILLHLIATLLTFSKTVKAPQVHNLVQRANFRNKKSNQVA